MKALFALLDHPLARRHRTAKILKFLRGVEANGPEGLDIHLAMDDDGTHRTSAIKRCWPCDHGALHT